MSTRFVGFLVTISGGVKKPLVAYRVSMHYARALYNSQIGSAVTDLAGRFEITYRRDHSNVGDHRTLELRAADPVGRPLVVHPTEFNPVVFRDEDSDLLSQGDFVVLEADASGLLVTLDTGETPETHGPGEGTPPTVASGWGLSHGNAVTLLIDSQAFIHTAARLKTAQQSVVLSQLFFPVPNKFDAPDKEEAKLVFDFGPFPPDAANPRAITPTDARPERLLIDAADRNVESRVLIHGFDIPLFLNILVGLLVFPFAGTDGAFAANEALENKLTDSDEAIRYFDQSGRTAIKVREFEQHPLSAGVMHAKLGVFDEKDGLCIGSPYKQNWIDTREHHIDEPVRGDNDGFPQHDAGFAVRGPAVGDLHRNLQMLWNEDASTDRMDTLPRNPPLQSAGGDGICSMQIVRTLSAKRFDDKPEGEKGILEGYLRAIESAEDFIYLETQYFTDDVIGRALVAAMKRGRARPGKPDLQVILVLNIRPDVPFYPFKQRRLITRIRKAIGQTPTTNQQFGVFTRWTHEVTPQRARILPVYVHAKIGVVDDKWATVGSANLDGLSLNSCHVGDTLNRIFASVLNRDLFTEQRAIEVNANMFNDLGQSPCELASILRRKLWAEHFGLFVGGVPREDHPLLTTPFPGGWLQLWIQQSNAVLTQLKTDPSASTSQMARVLPWPDKDTTYKTPLKHIRALGINPYRLAPLKSTRKFDFRKGSFKPKSVAKMDY